MAQVKRLVRKITLSKHTFAVNYAFRKISWTRRTVVTMPDITLPDALRSLADMLEKTEPETVGAVTVEGPTALSLTIGVVTK